MTRIRKTLASLFSGLSGQTKSFFSRDVRDVVIAICVGLAAFGLSMALIDGSLRAHESKARMVILKIHLVFYPNQDIPKMNVQKILDEVVAIDHPHPHDNDEHACEDEIGYGERKRRALTDEERAAGASRATVQTSTMKQCCVE